PHPITDEGYIATSLSPDGSRLTVVSPHQAYYTFSVADGELESIPEGNVDGDKGYLDGDTVIQWSTDGLSLFLRASDETKRQIFTVDRTTYKRKFWGEFGHKNTEGLIGVATDPGQFRLTRDGKSYAYTYWTFPGDLFLLEGLK